MPTMKISSGVEMNYIIPSSPDPSALSIDTARPTVVMLHPWFFDSHFFAPQYRDSRLAKGYNLVAIDHHYHGKTKVVLDDQPYDWQKVAKDIFNVMDALKITEAHIIGNSLGAHIAVIMAIMAPKRIQSLTLIAQPNFVESEDNLEQFAFLRDSWFARADDGSDRLASDVVKALQYIFFNNDSSSQSLIDEWVVSSGFRPSASQLIRKVFSAVLDRKSLDISILDSITCPVLIVHGENDVPAPPSIACDTFQALRNTSPELLIVEGAPHLLSYTHAAVVNRHVADFLDRTTGVDSRAAALAPRKLSTASSFRVGKQTLGGFFGELIGRA